MNSGRITAGWFAELSPFVTTIVGSLVWLTAIFAAAAIAVGANPHRSLPAIGSLDGLGVNIHFTDPQVGELEMIKAAGFKWVRMDLTWAATVYNGLDLSAYHDVPHDPDGYLAFVGRIAEEKGPLAAIEVARRSRLPLRMAAKVDPLDVPYYEEEVEPEMGRDVDFVGEIEEHEKPAFYAGARATLFPSDWPEPFGLVMIESLAAGTPVVALRRGSVPEVIEHGVTGFICEDVDEMVEATRRIGDIDPDACRQHAERFSADAMCRGYAQVYESLLHGRGSARPRR